MDGGRREGGGGDDGRDGRDGGYGYGRDAGDYGGGDGDGGDDGGGDGRVVAVVSARMQRASSSRPTRELPIDWVTQVVRQRRSSPMDQGQQVSEQEVPQAKQVQT